jgi:hypothetical protein
MFFFAPTDWRSWQPASSDKADLPFAERWSGTISGSPNLASD